MIATAVPTELFVIAGIVVLIFGVRKLPDIGKGLGQGIKEFKDATKKGGEEQPPAAPPVNPPASPPTTPPATPTD